MNQPSYLTIREFGDYIGISHRTLEGWKSKGYLPPHTPLTKKIHRWKRSDIDAWFALKQRGLFGDWPEMRAKHGECDAWALMLKRLDA